MKLAIVATHPIQYQVPWFRMLHQQATFDTKVFFLWNRSEGDQFDPGFGTTVQWDVDLHSGYDHEFVPNIANNPGTDHFSGLINPGLTDSILAYNADAVLFLAYRYRSLIAAIGALHRKGLPLLFRGDSHLLARQPVLKSIAKQLSLRTLFRMFSAILYVGSANKAYFRSFGVTEKQLFFCPHAVPTNLFPARMPRWDNTSTTVTLLFSGKLIAKKQPDLLLRCFNELQLPDAKLLFVGTGELFHQLQQSAADNPNVQMYGFLNQSELADLYRQASLLVLPSKGPYETWGIVVQECAQMGIPALVSTHVGCGPDLVLPDKSGFLFNAEEPSDLLRALREVSDARARLPRMGEHANELSRRYSYETATAGLLAAIQYIQGAQ